METLPSKSSILLELIVIELRIGTKNLTSLYARFFKADKTSLRGMKQSTNLYLNFS